MTTELLEARESLAAEWRERNPATPSEIAEFYKSSHGMEADLDAWHQTEERQLWTDAVVGAVKASGARRVLDVGAGAGHDLIELAKRCGKFDLLAGVEPNRALRKKLQTLGLVCYEDIDLVHERDLDLIVCLDVLEHVPDPDALLVKMIDRLKLGGILVEATATHDLGTPLHLPQLRGWQPGRTLDRYGFVLGEQVDRLRVWQRQTEKRVAAPTLLLCAYRALGVQTALAFSLLLQRGWRYKIHSGDALISRVRSIAVSRWLRETDDDVFLMVDDDIAFRPEDAERVVALAREKRAIACAAYPVRGGTHLACRLATDTTSLVCGPEAQPLEIRYAGTGFMAAHRDVCEAIAATMPLCHEDVEWAMWPLFMPMVVQDTGVHEYLSEDWAFCRRAKELGYATWLDPSVILTHLGQAAYTVHTMQGAVPEPPPTETGAS